MKWLVLIGHLMFIVPLLSILVILIVRCIDGFEAWWSWSANRSRAWRWIGIGAYTLIAVVLSSLPACSHGADSYTRDGYRWTKANVAPCARADIVWVKESWPIASGTDAYVDFATCTIHSGWTEAEAKTKKACGVFSRNPTSIWQHEHEHLELAEIHPNGEELCGWGGEEVPRVFGPPEPDVAIVRVLK